MKRWLPVVLCLFALGACGRAPSQNVEFFVFGTLVSVQVPGEASEETDKVFAELSFAFQEMHRQWHAWEPGELGRVNAALEAGQAIQTTPHIETLIRRSQELERLSGGRFNPAIGALVALWGFHTSNYPVIGPPPRAAQIDRLLASRPSALDVHLGPEGVSSSNTSVQLDFGGIAKGYATDLGMDILRRHGIDNAVINAGGDTRIMGNNHGKPWRIAVSDPAGGVAGVVELGGDQAIFTSGNYARFREDASERYPHILDPRSGWPVSGIIAATVIAADGATADATATAVVVAGSEDWAAVARGMGVTAVLVINQEGAIEATPEMMAHFTPAPGRAVKVRESKGD